MYNKEFCCTNKGTFVSLHCRNFPSSTKSFIFIFQYICNNLENENLYTMRGCKEKSSTQEEFYKALNNSIYFQENTRKTVFSPLQ